MPQPTIYEYLGEELEKEGAVHDVDADYFAAFLKMNDKDLRQLIRAIINGSAKEINRMVFDEQKQCNDAALFRLVENSLSLMFRGWLCLTDDGIGMIKPVGPEPTPEVERLLEERVANARPLVRRAFVEILTRMCNAR